MSSKGTGRICYVVAIFTDFGRISDWIQNCQNDLDKHGQVVLDFNMDKVIYKEYAKMLSYPSDIESCEKDYVDFVSEDSLSSLIEKKKKS